MGKVIITVEQDNGISISSEMPVTGYSLNTLLEKFDTTVAGVRRVLIDTAPKRPGNQVEHR